LNRFLTINKNILLLSLLILVILFFSFLLINNYKITETQIIDTNFSTNVDIINPKFTINNNNKKIYVRAAKGNFINEDLVLLEEEVYFESSDFKIYSDKVTFNRKNETANSNSKSKFESEGTTIISEGFEITDKGDVILFDGKTSLTLN
tara:strand:- start:440 stop:886 length:447 start_codon:yes stop_codon:yes gene_type:complete